MKIIKKIKSELDKDMAILSVIAALYIAEFLVVFILIIMSLL